MTILTARYQIMLHHARGCIPDREIAESDGGSGGQNFAPWTGDRFRPVSLSRPSGCHKTLGGPGRRPRVRTGMGDGGG